MFRLVKVLNGNIQYEVTKLPFSAGTTIKKGCPLVCLAGNAVAPTATAVPEYVALSDSADSTNGKIDAMIITEEMVFRVEYTGTMTPVCSMEVAMTNLKSTMDAVTFNTSGKGIIIGFDDDKKTVYVRFRK